MFQSECESVSIWIPPTINTTPFRSNVKYHTIIPPLKRTMAFRQAYSEWSMRSMAHLASSSRSRLASSLRICRRSDDRLDGISCDSSTGKFHCAAVSTNSSHQDSSRRIAWSLYESWQFSEVLMFSGFRYSWAIYLSKSCLGWFFFLRINLL